ncbi:MAG: MBL fold metallo-hydrolase [Acidobacteria bacterium]|nr:MBL fold metallo-hydrolase [Acidobacteriota bacterium]
MNRSLSFTVLVVAALTACTPTPPEQQTLTNIADALGGRDRILAVHTLTLEGEGMNWNVGQDMTMDATGQTFAVTGYKRELDLDAVRMRVQQTRTPNFLYYQGQAAQTQRFGLDGDVAYSIGANDAVTRNGRSAMVDRRTEYFHHPVTLLRAALNNAATVAGPRSEGNETWLDITVPDAGTFSLAVDAQSNLPARVRSRGAHPNLGDVVIETEFSDYAEVDGLNLPQRFVTSIDRYRSTEMRLSRPTLSASAADLAAPAEARDAAAPGAPAINVVAEVVAPGVWLLAGQSHHSALIEFADHLVLVEAPQSEARTLAVIAKARELVPGKRLTQLISSHFHFDHTAGIRAAVAEGLSVITQDGNVAYVEDVIRRPHTEQPDALQRQPQPLTIEGFRDSKVLEDTTRRVELYHLSGNPHADTLLAAYLPAERVLIQVDAFSPGAPVNPYAANLLEQIRARKLQVNRIVSLHGPIVPLAELVKAVPAS